MFVRFSFLRFRLPIGFSCKRLNDRMTPFLLLTSGCSLFSVVLYVFVFTARQMNSSSKKNNRYEYDFIGIVYLHFMLSVSVLFVVWFIYIARFFSFAYTSSSSSSFLIIDN